MPPGWEGRSSPQRWSRSVTEARRARVPGLHLQLPGLLPAGEPAPVLRWSGGTCSPRGDVLVWSRGGLRSGRCALGGLARHCYGQGGSFSGGCQWAFKRRGWLRGDGFSSFFLK